MVEEELAEQEEKHEDSLKGESIGSVGYIEDFDIYRSYEPSEIVSRSSSLSDGMYIQIGDVKYKVAYINDALKGA